MDLACHISCSLMFCIANKGLPVGDFGVHSFQTGAVRLALNRI